MLALVLTAGWIWLSRPTPGQFPADIHAPQEGFLAPTFSLFTFDGNKVDLSELKGKVVMINFWASWCPPCKAEMQSIQQVYQDDQNQGLVILAVNTNYQDDLQTALQFAQSEGLTFTLLKDSDGSVTRLFKVRALPSTFFVDRQGKIQHVTIGGPMSEALIRTQIASLLGAGQ